MFNKFTYILVLLGLLLSSTALNAQSWILARSEHFDTDQTLSDQVPFGEDNWLTTRIRNSGSIVVSGGRALVSTPDFEDSAMIRIVESLPSEYKLRVRIGDVHYSTTEYEAEDFENPSFKYNSDSGYPEGYSENGLYWLTLTDRLIEPDSGEDWWHRYRKIVMDSDDHLDVSLPLYMVYMNPDLDRTQGDWTYGMANLLRCWQAGEWHTSGWLVAFNYEIDTNYEVEIEKYNGQLKMRTYNSAGTIIEDTDWVDLDLIYAMGDGTSPEYAYFGEPHIDSYEGSAWIDDIQLWIINSAPQIDPLGDQTIATNELFRITVAATDSTFLDGVSLSAANLPIGSSFDPETGLFEWTPSDDQEGSYNILFTAIDGYGLIDIETLNLVVEKRLTSVDPETPTSVDVTGGCGLITKEVEISLGLFLFLIFSVIFSRRIFSRRRKTS